LQQHSKQNAGNWVKTSERMKNRIKYENRWSMCVLVWCRVVVVGVRTTGSALVTTVLMTAGTLSAVALFYSRWGVLVFCGVVCAWRGGGYVYLLTAFLLSWLVERRLKFL
jgi:uncharacterized membrane protein YobD (UPF0266 family)